MKRLLVFLFAAVVALGIAFVSIRNPAAANSSNTNMKGEIMESELVSVNTYSLAGDGIEIEISMKDPKALELVYKDKQGVRKFSGDAIDLIKLELGFMASVVLEQFPDLRIITLCLAVPSANRTNNEKSIRVDTFAIRTTTLTSLVGPRLVKGQIQTYEIHVLKGNAW
jgi:hypothetical protein